MLPTDHAQPRREGEQRGGECADGRQGQAVDVRQGRIELGRIERTAGRDPIEEAGDRCHRGPLEDRRLDLETDHDEDQEAGEDRELDGAPVTGDEPRLDRPRRPESFPAPWIARAGRPICSRPSIARD